MNKKLLSVLLLVVMLFTSISAFAAIPVEDTDDPFISIKSVDYNDNKGELTLVVKNESDANCAPVMFVFDTKDKSVELEGLTYDEQVGYVLYVEGIDAGAEKTVIIPAIIEDYEENDAPVINCQIGYIEGEGTVVDVANPTAGTEAFYLYEDIFKYSEDADKEAAVSKKSEGNAVVDFAKQTGFWMIIEQINWQSVVMILIACVLLYLAIVKKFEPLLLLPIAFGMLLTNLLGAEIFHEEIFANGHVHWDYFGSDSEITPGLIDVLYLGVKLGIYPCLIFIGVGAMTDFGPLIANPKSLILGAAAQIGIFATFIGAYYLGFTPQQAGSIGIIGGADGPTAIFLTSKLAPELLGPIAVAAYSYMALVPVIQPPIMKLLTSKKERQIVMRELRPVSKTEKIVFPIVVTIFVALLVPSAAPLVGSLMLGNLMKESGVCERLSKTVQNELMNIVTVFLGISVGATATASTFLSFETIKIIVMGVVAFGVATACGLLIAKFMNLFLKEKINPLIGSAGVSAVPMAARVSQKVGQAENPSNFLLMHAMGPNVAGVIGSAIAAGALLAMLG